MPAQYARAKPDLASTHMLAELLPHTWMIELLSPCNEMFTFESSNNLCRILICVIKILIT